MKNRSAGKKIGMLFSIMAALIASVIFWLVIKYIDSMAPIAYEATRIVWATL